MPKKQPNRIRLRTGAGAFPRVVSVGQRPAPYEDLYYHILTMPWPWFLTVVAVAFAGLNALFACLYAAQAGSVANARPGSLADAFFFSVQTMATIGYGTMHPVTLLANILVVVEAMIGVLGFAVMAGITFARFSRPRARVLFAERAVIGPRDGVPHLMFRMANSRHNHIIEGRLHVILLVTERTREGEELRRQVDIPLLRSHTPVFNLTWTAMHRIDPESPFYGPDARERLRAANAEIYLTLSGVDEAMAQSIHARYFYHLDEVLWDARFADVLSVTPDGALRIDYRAFHEVLPCGRADHESNDDPV